MVIDPSETDRIRRAVEILRRDLLSLVAAPGINDLAFIGSASDRYEWVPSRIVDFDAFFFVDERGPTVGHLLDRAFAATADAIGLLDIDLEVKIIQGNYKPDVRRSDPPRILAHLGVFTETHYLTESAVKRWAWRKYRCQVEPARLQRLAPTPPTAVDLLHGSRGVAEKLRDIRSGFTTMAEWPLPDLSPVERTIGAEDPSFAEFCHGAAATSARHHARVLGHPEADSAGNAQFFIWYDQNVLSTESLLPLMRLKERGRNEGYEAMRVESRALAGDFLQTLADHLSRGEQPIGTEG